MIIIDFFSLTGATVNPCAGDQVDMMLPILRTLYGAVTMVERGAAVDVAGDDFTTWLMEV